MPSKEIKISSFQDLNKAKGFKLVHLNIRSLYDTIDQLRATLYNSSVNVITLSETWLRKGVSDSMIKIEGYRTFRLDRTNRLRAKRGGGLLVYIKENLAAETATLDNLNLVSSDVEAQWLEIRRPVSKNNDKPRGKGTPGYGDSIF